MYQIGGQVVFIYEPARPRQGIVAHLVSSMLGRVSRNIFGIGRRFQL
jgi:hypothetical protein